MIIVTGGAGFIGSNIVRELEARGTRDIAVCDLLGSDDKWKNIAKRELSVILPPEDLFEFLSDNAPDIETVFHMGAVSATTERDADLIVRSNIRLSLDLWNWCAQHDAALIYASSAATYGDGAQGFAGDDSIDPPVQPPSNPKVVDLSELLDLPHRHRVADRRPPFEEIVQVLPTAEQKHHRHHGGGDADATDDGLAMDDHDSQRQKSERRDRTRVDGGQSPEDDPASHRHGPRRPAKQFARGDHRRDRE